MKKAPSKFTTILGIEKTSSATKALSPIASAVRVSILGLGLAHGISHSATIEVTSNLDDDTNCTLREAIVSINDSTSNGSAALQAGCVNIGANAFGSNDSITFSNNLSDNTITLTNGQLVIAPNSSVDIDASNITAGITINADDRSRVFFTDSANLSAHNIIISGGLESKAGGFHATNKSNVSLTNSIISNNTASYGGDSLPRTVR